MAKATEYIYRCISNETQDVLARFRTRRRAESWRKNYERELRVFHKTRQRVYSRLEAMRPDGSWAIVVD